MKPILTFISILSPVLSSLMVLGQATSDSLYIEAGVSKALAEDRAKRLSHIAYQLSFDIPSDNEAPVYASEIITFDVSSLDSPLLLDFKEDSGYLKRLEANGKEIDIQHIREHIVVSSEYLQKGKNKIQLQFIAGNLSLNRDEDFLYTLLVPDRARTVFPCFDQPNLKATFQLSLALPTGWSALTNAPLQDSMVAKGRKIYHFLSSDTLSTYLFSFAAGRFDKVSQQADGRTMHFYHRETDSTKIKESLAPIFQIHADALAFMEAYTQIPYPFQKFDFVAIPDFQYGGMEHVGAIDYKASALFLDEGATQDQEISRSSLIAHETAHMWFGDLVTMRWFNDVWMKEVFANFMADKITKIALPEANYDLKFLIDHFPAAYEIDRTAGANPIRQSLENLQEAGTLYGGVIYHKAPIVMRQLELLMGEEAFRQGLRAYLKKYAYGNASWPDLVKIMDNLTPADLQAWNEVWVNETGRPQFDYKMTTTGGKISQLTISQQGEDGPDSIWPQLFDIGLVYTDHTETMRVEISQLKTNLQEAVGKEEPMYVIFNTSGQGYGLFPVDEAMLNDLYTIEDTVTRASVYINLYENMLNGRFVTPDQLLTLLRKGLQQEKQELNLKLITDYLSTVYWQFTKPAERRQLTTTLEAELWQAMQQNKEPNQKKILLKAYQNIALSEVAQKKLYTIWKNEQPPANIKLTEDDYTSLALALALRAYQQPDSLLTQQLSRIQNPDRKKRLQFLIPALSEDDSTRHAFFMSLKDVKNREKESWIVSALGYLHHPLRANTSITYLPASLELLEEIQQTGDIFFPQRWLGATFGSYQSIQAARTVRGFLEERPEYNPRLKAKILQATDGLFRAERLLYGKQ